MKSGPELQAPRHAEFEAIHRRHSREVWALVYARWLNADIAMDITQEKVQVPIREIVNPEERLRALIRLHIQLVLRARDREITVILHENHPLPPGLRKRVNARKKEYIHFVEQQIAEVQRVRKSKNVSHRAAAFALLGMINWIYQWYRTEGPLQEEELIQQYTEIFFAGAFQ